MVDSADPAGAALGDAASHGRLAAGAKRPGAWLRPGLVLLIPTVALLVAVPLYRIHQIPEVSPGFSMEEYTGPRGRSVEDDITVDMYRSAYSRALRPQKPPSLSRYEPQDSRPLKSLGCATNDTAIELAMKACQRPTGNLANHSLLPSGENFSLLARLLTCAAVVKQDDGKLDAALDRYLAAVRIAVVVHKCFPMPILRHEPYVAAGSSIEWEIYDHLPFWAAGSGQNRRRILDAMRQLEQLTCDVTPSESVKLAHFRAKLFLSGDVRHFPPLPLTEVWLRLPWERERAMRMVNWMARSQLDCLAAIEDSLRKGEAIAPIPPNRLYREQELNSVPYSLNRTINVPPVFLNPSVARDRILAEYTSIVTSRRAVQLVLALEAWKLEHSSLPKTLGELVGHGLERLPLDPHSGKPFRYFPEGLKIPLRWRQPGASVYLCELDEIPRTVAPNVPFVWASGGKLRGETGNSAPEPGAYVILSDDSSFEEKAYRARSSPKSGSRVGRFRYRSFVGPAEAQPAHLGWQCTCHPNVEVGLLPMPHGERCREACNSRKHALGRRLNRQSASRLVFPRAGRRRVNREDFRVRLK